MLLYFTNDSKQKKILIESDYVEDIYDEIQAFFEEHHIRPHFINVVSDVKGCIISWNSQTEKFVCEGIAKEQVEELKILLEHN